MKCHVTSRPPLPPQCCCHHYWQLSWLLQCIPTSHNWNQPAMTLNSPKPKPQLPAVSKYTCTEGEWPSGTWICVRWKDMLNFVMQSCLHIHTPINVIRLIVMCNLHAHKLFAHNAHTIPVRACNKVELCAQDSACGGNAAILPGLHNPLQIGHSRWWWWWGLVDTGNKVKSSQRNTLPGRITLATYERWQSKHTSFLWVHFFLACHSNIIACSHWSFSSGVADIMWCGFTVNLVCRGIGLGDTIP